MHSGFPSAHRIVRGARSGSLAITVGANVVIGADVIQAILVYLVAVTRRWSIVALLVLLGAAPPAWPASPQAQLALAKAAYKLQDYAGALQLFRDAAEGGEPAAMAGLGSLYALGLGAPANDREAVRWFKKAAALNDDWAPEINKLLSAVDPHTSYMTEAEYRDFSIQTRGDFGGLGIELGIEEGRPKVVTPIDDTPAAAAGLKAGDVFIGIDGAPTDGLSLKDVIGRLRGPPGSAVRLTVARSQQAPFEVTLTRAVIRLRPVKSALQDGSIGYLRITLFSEQTQPQTLAALDQLKRQAGGRLAGLVLDLRNDPGGLLTAAVAVTGDFLDGGTVVRFAPWRGRRAANDNGFSAPLFGDHVRGTPIIVLINNGSASASEIVAGALQDHRRARILGTRSFGKGTVQSLLPLDGHGALRVTTAEYQLPSGRSIQARGITPDKTVLPDEAVQVPAGAKLVNEAQLLGAHADPIEPTVDPGAIGTARDTQLAAAMQELRAEIIAR